jgi:hypothetical protein
MFNNYQPAHSMHRWKGVSGQWYWFTVYGINEFHDFDSVVYIIARARYDGLFDPLYIGQSGQGSVRLSRHEKMPQARRLGASHVHVHFGESEALQFSTETDLRRLHYTPLNKQPTPVFPFLPPPPVPDQPMLGGLFGKPTPSNPLSLRDALLSFPPSPTPSHEPFGSQRLGDVLTGAPPKSREPDLISLLADWVEE